MKRGGWCGGKEDIDLLEKIFTKELFCKTFLFFTTKKIGNWMIETPRLKFTFIFTRNYSVLSGNFRSFDHNALVTEYPSKWVAGHSLETHHIKKRRTAIDQRNFTLELLFRTDKNHTTDGRIIDHQTISRVSDAQGR